MIREELLAELASALADVIRTNRVAMLAEREKETDATAWMLAKLNRRDATERYNGWLAEATDEERAEERKRALEGELARHVA